LIELNIVVDIVLIVLLIFEPSYQPWKYVFLQHIDLVRYPNLHQLQGQFPPRFHGLHSLRHHQQGNPAMSVSDERVERATNAYLLRQGISLKDFGKKAKDDILINMRAALEADAPALEAARVEGLREGLTMAREIASGQFGWEISIWRDMTKKDMTRLMAEAIVAAIDVRLASLAEGT
jgi:hypothetical protein